MKKDELLPRGQFRNREDYEAYLRKHLDVGVGHAGSSFDDFLDDEGLLSDATEVATKRVRDFLKDNT